jgi:hypothetical protein
VKFNTGVSWPFLHRISANTVEIYSRKDEFLFKLTRFLRQ